MISRRIRGLSLSAAVCLLCLFALPAFAHFGMVIPSAPVVTTPEQAKLTVDLKFWHPFENQGMELQKPTAFSVRHGDKTTDLLPALKQGKEQDKTVWQAAYTVPGPGLYAFLLEPAPYFEPAEDKFIIHYTKAYVEAFGDDEGWDEPQGQKFEITPLARPTGLYAGNVFQGRVLLNGEPVAGAEVEVEWYPGKDLRGDAPHESMVTQTVRADDAGVFTYAAPAPGWWGFAALTEADKPMKHQGKDKPVELGAVIWVYFHPMATAAPLKH